MLQTTQKIWYNMELSTHCLKRGATKSTPLVEFVGHQKIP